MSYKQCTDKSYVLEQVSFSVTSLKGPYLRTEQIQEIRALQWVMEQIA